MHNFWGGGGDINFVAIGGNLIVIQNPNGYIQRVLPNNYKGVQGLPSEIQAVITNHPPCKYPEFCHPRNLNPLKIGKYVTARFKIRDLL